MLRSGLNWKNAWRIRIVALGCIVLFLGVGSQVLVNAFAADSNTDTGVVPVTVSAYAMNGPMADGNWTHVGACAISPSQFPLGTIIALYNPDGSFNRQCTAEDIDGSIGQGHIDLAMPGNVSGAKNWGMHTLLARVLRLCWGNRG